MHIGGYLSWLWHATRGIRLPVACNALAGTLQVGVSLSFVWVSKHLVDMATDGQQHGTAFVVYACLMVACVVAQLLLSAAMRRIETLTDMRLSNRLRSRLFGHIMESRWAGREGMHTADMLNRMEEDVPMVSGLLCSTVPSVWVTMVRLVAAFVFLLLLDARLAIVLVLVMPVALLASKRYVAQMRRLTRDIRNTDSRVQTHMQENLQHRTLISTLERTAQSASALDSLQDELYSQVRRRTDFTVFSHALVQLGFGAGYTLAFLWGVFGLWHGTVGFGTLTAFLQLVGQVQRPVVDMGNHLPAFIHAYISVERICELESMPSERQGEPIRLHGAPGVRFQNVDYTYPDGQHAVLDGFTHDFVPGSLTAVLGETGAGKSTLVRLLLALLTPDSGRITLYDGQTSADASPQTRCNIVYVPQGNTLLRGTVRDNLLLGNPDATDDELRRALHLSVADFVLDMPLGLDTPCGELGAGLSEGQAQRIAIARGLLRPGGILLLDEPTSALDADTERTLMQRLAGDVHHKTLILVTHKEAAARFCTSAVRIEGNAPES